MFRLLLLLPLVAVASGKLNCDAEPIELPIRDVQVLPDVADSYMKGIAAKVGTPSQNVVLLPWAELNNTWLYDKQGYCDETIIWNDEICRVRRGNFFDADDSTTYNKFDDVVYAGGSQEENTKGVEAGIPKLVSSSLGGTDTLQLEGMDTPLKDFAIGTPRMSWDHGYTMLHPLGLGSNSTYLNALREAGQITSRVWSLFWGRMWIDEPVDGSLVFGGYDEKKIIGANYTAPLVFDDYTSSSGCWTGMKVTISDIKLNFRDGKDESILPANTALPCCIVPSRQLLLEAPGDYIANFEDLTKSKPLQKPSYGLHWSAVLYHANESFDGDITFHLSSGLEVRVPNDQYLTPYVDIDRNGSRIFYNETRELLMNPITGDRPATLGRYFFTAAYLMVNHDANTFTLWQANPSKSSSLVRVQDETTATQCNDTSALVQPTSTATGQHSQSASSSRPSAAVIGGSVAGSLAGVALIGAAVFFMLRRRNGRSAEEHMAPSTAPGEAKPPSYSPGYQLVQQSTPIQEVYGSQPVPHEFHGSTSFVYEMDSSERH